MVCKGRAQGLRLHRVLLYSQRGAIVKAGEYIFARDRRIFLEEIFDAVAAGQHLAKPDSSHRLTSDHRIRSSRAPKLDHLSETTSIGNRYTSAENIIAASMQVTPSVGPFLITLCKS